MPRLVDAFLLWKHRTALTTDPDRSAGEPRPDTVPSSEGGDWFTVAGICDTGTSSFISLSYIDYGS